jgi:ATP-dependent helicase/DNAse subunit B
MAKRLLLGAAAAGKSHYAIKLAQEAAGSLLAEVRVCVPTGLQARAWQARLAAAGGALGVHVLVFDQLAAACLDEAGETYTELDEAVQYRVLRTIIGQLPLEHYAPLKAKPGFVQVAQRLISELKAGLIDPVMFRQAIAELGDEPRLRELAEIYEAYQAQLKDQDWADRVGLHWLAVEALEKRATEACRDWPLLIVDGFDDFTSSQLALLKVLAERVEAFVMTLPKAEAMAYPRYKETQEDVEAALGVKGEALPSEQRATEAALHHVARNLFSLAPVKPLPGDEVITLWEAADRSAEVRSALRWLKEQIVRDGIPTNQVALSARDIAAYRPYVMQTAAEFGLPIRLVDGLPLRQSPIIAALMDLWRLFIPDTATGGAALPRRQVISAWRSPYFALEEEGQSITAADADRLDQLAREQRVIRGWEQWRAAFAAKPAMHEREEDEEEYAGRGLSARQVQDLEEKFAYFLRVTEPPAEATTMRDFVRWLERIIGPDPETADDPAQTAGSLQIIARARGNPETAEADVAALRALKEILRGLVWAEEAAGTPEPVSFLSFINELSGAILATHFFPAPYSKEEGVLVASATQVRGLSFDAVALMGLSEGSFPATISEDPFLRDGDRATLKEQFSFALQPSTQSAEREFFYEAVTRPRRRLLLTRPILAENGADWVASPYWEAVRQLTTQMPERIGSEEIVAADKSASWVEWWETVSAAAEPLTKDQVQDQATWQHINRAAGIWRARQEAERSIWEGDLQVVAENLSSEHGPDKIWSASRLETYQTCGFLFYLRYVLGVEPRPEPAEGLDARQLGSLYHRILEQVMRKEGLDFTDEAAVQEWVSGVARPILDAAPEEEGFRETPWWRQTQQEIINNVTSTIMALAGDGYEFLYSEVSFGIKSRPLIIEDGGDKLQLRGFIDRVDRQGDGRIRIIDYKLSSPYAYGAREFAEGKRLQLPLYALAAEAALALGSVTDGFYWHFRHEKKSPFQLSKAEGGVSGAIDMAIKHAWDVVQRVRDGQFQPRPPNNGCPSYCPAAGFCWQYTAKSW